MRYSELVETYQSQWDAKHRDRELTERDHMS
jgi:hypothetical protein